MSLHEALQDQGVAIYRSATQIVTVTDLPAQVKRRVAQGLVAWVPAPQQYAIHDEMTGRVEYVDTLPEVELLLLFDWLIPTGQGWSGSHY